MAFAPFDTFVGIVSADATRLLNGFHTLCVHNGRARIRIPTDAPALGLPQRPVDKGPKTCAAKLAMMIIDRLPRREIAGEVAPRTAGTQQVKERIEHGAEGVASEAAMW
jgi:hypothetical protein